MRTRTEDDRETEKEGEEKRVRACFGLVVGNMEMDDVKWVWW